MNNLLKIPKLSKSLALLVTAVLPSMPLKAIEMTVFCTYKLCNEPRLIVQQNEIEKGGGDITVFFLDEGRHFERFMSGELQQLAPSDEDEGAAMASELLQSPKGQKAMGKLNMSLEGINLAVEMDLQYFPAFVCNGKAVTYGGELRDAANDCQNFLTEVSRQ